MPRKRKLNWPEIKARYLAGELPATIAKDYETCTGQKVSNKARYYNWTAERDDLESKITEETTNAIIAEAKELRESLIAELKRIAFSDIADYVTIDEGGGIQLKPFDQMPAGASKVVKKVRERRKLLSAGEGSGDNVVIDSNLEYEFYDKLRASEILGKWCGFEKEKDEPVSGTTNNTVNLVITRPTPNEGVVEDGDE